MKIFLATALFASASGVALPPSLNATAVYIRGEGSGDRMHDGSNEFPWSHLAVYTKPKLSLASGYHSTDEIHNQIIALQANCGGKMTVTEGTRLANNNFIQEVTIKEGQGAKTNKVMYTFGVHGREALSAEIALGFIKSVCTTESDRASKILATTEFKIVPIVNPTGRKLMDGSTGTTGSCVDQRKNINGVDLNRNFNAHFHEGSTTTSAEDYRGSGAFSEPESQYIKSVVSAFKPTMFIDVHTGDKSMLSPYSYTKDVTPPEHQKHQDLLKFLDDKAFSGTMADKRGPGAAIGNPPYAASGTIADWVFMDTSVHPPSGPPLTFIFEAHSAGVSNKKDTATSHGINSHDEPPIAQEDFSAIEFVKELPSGQQQQQGDKALLPGTPSMLQINGHLSDADCFAYFNPTSEAGLNKATAQWGNALMYAAEYVAGLGH